ncbi:TerD family protein [Streptomyces sp. NPDC047130]|uniref:TerD family protein n=1 Tax=Streptomyces sp. NPDC047130 TaxID=3155261 RepID=UPI0033F5A1D4
MTAELVRGQNHPLTEPRPEVRVSAGRPVTVGAVLTDEQGRLSGVEGVVLPGGPAGPPGVGLPHPGDDGGHRVAVDLAALPETVHRVGILLALPAGQRFGGGPAPVTVVAGGASGSPLVSYTITGLDSECAVVALELYRRQGGWKVRAVGQGYAAGLEALLADHGLTAADARRLAAPAVTDGDWLLPSPGAPSVVAAGGPGEAAPAPDGTVAASGGVPAAGPAATGNATPPPYPAGGTGTGVPAGAAHLGDGAGARTVPSPDPGPAPAESPAGAGDRGVDYQHPGRGGTDGAGTAAAAGVHPLPDPAATPHATPAGPTPPLPPTGPAAPASTAAPAGTVPGAPDAQPPATPGGGQRVDYRHPRRQDDPPGGPTAQDVPVAGDAAGWSMEERLYNQVWGMFEDLARAVAAHRGAVEFADERLDQELDGVLGDYRVRADGSVDRVRREARARREELVQRAQQVLDQQLGQLRAESEVVEPALPPAYARWESPVWAAYRAPEEQPLALRLGDLSLPESGDLRIPLLLRLPLERGLWIDSGQGRGAESLLVTPEERHRLALDMAVALAARLLAAHPPGDFTVHVIDAAGAGARSLSPLSRSGVLAEPPAVGPGGVSGLLTRLAGHVDLVQMAVRAGAAESLPPGTDLSQRLLIVHDFPHAFDDRAVTALRYLADEGPRAGVHLLVVADREDAAGFGALLDPLWRSLLRLTPVPEDHLADPWVCHAWTYEPSLPPRDGATLERVLDSVAAARRR